eukprot:TRINITY_DN2108_c0_g2_i1.p2 TRINITY_DN2108_c0_g2~~TRINITY_DN2108_c0_g2_i1.p2  ORF type:complete len:244 (+),score=43.10 TRINITY_DN2108_c0_g2_i1:459-1190(+)
MIVVHPSLLPKYRGAAPLHHALINGEKETGVSFIEISKGEFDAGRILLQEKYEVPPQMTYKELADELSTRAGLRIVTLLANLDHYRKHAVPQDPSLVSKAPKLDTESTFLDFESMTSEEIYNRWRSFHGSSFQNPRAYFQDQVFLFDDMSLLAVGSEEFEFFDKKHTNARAGSIWCTKMKKFKNNLYVKCKNGWIAVKGGYIQTKQPAPAYKFIEQQLNRESFKDNDQLEGLYFFTRQKGSKS